MANTRNPGSLRDDLMDKSVELCTDEQQCHGYGPDIPVGKDQ
jgi:hypothetical protein